MKAAKQDLTRARVVTLLECYGGDLSRFPEAERDAARDLIESDPSLQAVQREASSLDAWLDDMPTPVPSAGLRRAVAEIPLRHPRTAEGKAPWLGVLELFGVGKQGRLLFAASFLVALGAGVSAGRLVSGGSDVDYGGHPQARVTSVTVPQAQAGQGMAATGDEAGEAWEAFTALAFADSFTLEATLDDELGLGETL